MSTSRAVDMRVKNLWAVLASHAARKAVERIQCADDRDAEKFANVAAKWLARAGAEAARCTYRQPPC